MISVKILSKILTATLLCFFQYSWVKAMSLQPYSLTQAGFIFIYFLFTQAGFSMVCSTEPRVSNTVLYFEYLKIKEHLKSPVSELPPPNQNLFPS